VVELNEPNDPGCTTLLLKAADQKIKEEFAMTVINTNVGATITQNALAKNDRLMGQAMERLSTGKRINSASDDAAGLAISSRMTAQIKGLDQAARNANDAIAMIQTADGASIEVSNMLQRMRELAIQSITETNTATDRSNLSVEFVELQAEISRISTATQWNGENILDGSAGTNGTVNFQVGANADQTINVDLGDWATDGTGVFSNLGTEPNNISSTAVAATYSIPAAAISAAGTVAQTISDGTTTVTVTQAASATVAAQVTAIQAGAGYASLSFTVAANSAGDSLEFTYKTAGAITTDPTVTEAGSSVTVTEATSGSDAISLNSSALAATALAKIDTAINGINTQRATYGAVMNRLEYVVDNLANVSQNAAASRSRVEDADYAIETTELARTQIIQQAGTAMLAQANQSAQSVLQLLKG
jgi:flagellin